MIFENFQKSSEYFGNSSKQFLTSFYDFLNFLEVYGPALLEKLQS